MKYVRTFYDLTPLGIDALTGEACGLGYRLLCDVTAQGKHVVEKCLGAKLVLEEAWNQGADHDPHIGSLMLAHELFLPIGVFALLESGCREVWKTSDALVGIEASDTADEIERSRCFLRPVRRFAYRGTAGDRNIHQMTGRIQ